MRVQSPVGRNYVLCYKRYGFKVEDDLGLVSDLVAAALLGVVRFQCSCLFIDCCHINFAFELIKLRAGILYTRECEWSRAQIDCMLIAIGTRDCL